MYKKFADAVKVPILANITEFGADAAIHGGRTRKRRRRDGALPAVGVSRDEPGRAQGLSGARRDGTQRNVVDSMQTRNDLYDYSQLPRLRAEDSISCSRRARSGKQSSSKNSPSPRPLPVNTGEGIESSAHRRRENRSAEESRAPRHRKAVRADGAII